MNRDEWRRLEGVIYYLSQATGGSIVLGGGSIVMVIIITRLLDCLAFGGSIVLARARITSQASVASIVLTITIIKRERSNGHEHSHDPERSPSEHSPGNSVVKGFGLAGLSRRAAAETLRWLKTME